MHNLCVRYGFDNAAMIAVTSSALGGLIVSAVLKYADNIARVYAQVQCVTCGTAHMCANVFMCADVPLVD